MLCCGNWAHKRNEQLRKYNKCVMAYKIICGNCMLEVTKQNAKSTEDQWSETKYVFLKHLVENMLIQ